MPTMMPLSAVGFWLRILHDDEERSFAAERCAGSLKARWRLRRLIFEAKR